MAPQQLRSCTLLLLPLLFAAVMVAGDDKRTSSATNFQAHLLGRVGTADAEDYKQDTIDLVEQRFTNCRYSGCQNWVRSCNATGDPCDGSEETGCPTCSACEIGNSWTSQFTCRKDTYGYKSEDSIDFGQLAQGSTGECYWDVMWYRQDIFDGEDRIGCGWIPINALTSRMGSATARCFFPGGDKCGEPLCSSLTVTISGEVYTTDGYTRTPVSGDTVMGSDAVICLLPTHVGCLQSMEVGRSPRLRQLVASGRAHQKKAADNTKAGAASVNYNYEGNHQTNTYYPAGAIVISGSITSINGQKYVKNGRYTDGTVLYVPLVAPTGAPVASVPSDAIVVTPQAYSFSFVKDGARYYSK